MEPGINNQTPLTFFGISQKLMLLLSIFLGPFQVAAMKMLQEDHCRCTRRALATLANPTVAPREVGEFGGQNGEMASRFMLRLVFDNHQQRRPGMKPKKHKLTSHRNSAFVSIHFHFAFSFLPTIWALGIQRFLQEITVRIWRMPNDQSRSLEFQVGPQVQKTTFTRSHGFFSDVCTK